MIEVNQLCGQLHLGKQGENLARIVYFDEIATWKKEFGEGKCELLHQRNGDTAPYPVKLEMENDRCCWKVTASDTAIVGDGKCELHYLVDDVVVKSKIWTTTVLESLGGEIAEPPAPEQAWVDEVLGAAQKVEDATVHPPVIGENKNWWLWDFESSAYVDSGICAEPGNGKGNESNLPFSNLMGIDNTVYIRGYKITSINTTNGCSCIIETTGGVKKDISNELLERRFNVFYKENESLEKVRSFIESATMIDGDFTKYKVVFSHLHPQNYLPNDFECVNDLSILGNLVMCPDENGEFPSGVFDLEDSGENFTSAIFGTDNVGYIGTICSGIGNIAAAYCAVTMGRGNFVDQEYGVALGYKNKVHKHVGCAMGTSNEVNGLYGTALGRGLKVLSDYQSVTGEYNIPDLIGKYCFIVGNGKSDTERSNGLTVDWDGNVEALGEVKDGKGNILSDKMDMIPITEEASYPDASTMAKAERLDAVIKGSYGDEDDGKEVMLDLSSCSVTITSDSTNEKLAIGNDKKLIDGGISPTDGTTKGSGWYAFAEYAVGYEIEGTDKLSSAVVEIDLMKAKDFSGLRVYSRRDFSSNRIQWQYIPYECYIYISDDGKNWVKSNLIRIPETAFMKHNDSVNAPRFVDLPFSYDKGEPTNVCVRYVRIEFVKIADRGQKHFGAEEIRLLKPVKSIPTWEVVKEYINKRLKNIEAAFNIKSLEE